MSQTEQKRKQAQDARNRLAGTVGELSTAVDDAVTLVKERAQRVAPLAAGGAVALAALKLVRRRSSRRSAARG